MPREDYDDDFEEGDECPMCHFGQFTPVDSDPDHLICPCCDYEVTYE